MDIIELLEQGGGYIGGTGSYIGTNTPGGTQTAGGDGDGGDGYGGGGSGYIGNSLLTDKVMYCYNCPTSSDVNTLTYVTTDASDVATSNYVKTGNGAAKITILRRSKKVTYSENYGELPIPTKLGYNFVGWNTKSDGSGNFINSDTEVTNYEEHTLYAIWEQIIYSISYNANGGSGAPSAQTKIYGQTLVLSSTQPTRTGYTFLGWSTSSTATSSSYTSGSEFTINDNITLYAVWKPNNPVESYICANGSAGSSPYLINYTGNCTMIDDGNGNWRVKFLSDGTLTVANDISIDAFLVGGGGGGGGDATSDSNNFGSGGGGGGYTGTFNNISIIKNQEYQINIGEGGAVGATDAAGSDGGTTTAFDYSVLGGMGGQSRIAYDYAGYGGAGGSGGGCGGYYAKDAGDGGSYGNAGGNREDNNYGGGEGQGTTTCEFGEGSLTACDRGDEYAYAGGGRGGAGKDASAGSDGVASGPTANTGGGGSGSSRKKANGTAGGSGIVVIRNNR